MGTKRSIDSVHPSRRDQVTHPKRKKAKPDHLSGRSFKKAHPVNGLKTRVRDLTRLLSKSDDKLPAHIRVAKERELETTQHDLDQAQTAEKRGKMIMRYHQVRFFDRQKATKRLKSAKKRLKELDKQDAYSQRVAQAEIDELEIDLNYAMYYPLDKPYSSLFPKSDSGAETGHGANIARISKGDESMRELVKQCMSDGRLKELREGTLSTEDGDASASKSETKPDGRRPKAGSDAKMKQPDTGQDDQDSDGGFFE